MRIPVCIGLLVFLLSASIECRAEENSSAPHTKGQQLSGKPDLPRDTTAKYGKQMQDISVQETTFDLKAVVFEGHTAFSDHELMQVAEPFLGMRVGLADLEALRYRLTRMYVDNGYVNSGALILPGQNVDDGVVTFSIREGHLDKIEITGNGRLRPGYLKSRLWPDPEKPFNTHELQEHFQLLLQDPLIEQMRGRIRPGTQPGQAFLDVEVVRARPYSLRMIADNHRPPSTGAERILLAGEVRNLTGYGDVLYASGGISEGADEAALGYAVLLNARNTRLSLDYSYNENSVIEEPMRDIDIESETESLDITIMHPVHQSLQRSINLGLALSIRENKTFLLDMPFSFSPGALKGESKVTALRLVQSFLDRTTHRAFALRSVLSIGVDLFDATIHSSNRLPDSEFVAWLGQVQYARRLPDRFGQLILRADAQLAADDLLSLEKIAVGGAGTVRGYRENELVRDNGLVFSVEWRYPLWGDGFAGSGADHLLQIAAFMDYGTAWNKGEDMADEYLHSVGIGLLWTLYERIRAELYWAEDLEEAAPKQEYNLQDDGIHFRISVDML